MKYEEYGTLLQDADSRKLKYSQINLYQCEVAHHRSRID
jgi:hypothetical protein